MGILTPCPATTALTAIIVNGCKEDIGQVQRVMFQRIYKADGTLNTITIASEDPTLKATWTALTAAADSTKVVVSPIIENPEFEAGEARTYGGGNETVGGEEIILGREHTGFKGRINRAPQSQIKSLKSLMVESIGVFLIDEHGRIIMQNDGKGTPIDYLPIPIQTFFVSDKNPGGRDAPDYNMLSFKLKPNWSDNLQIVTPAFDAYAELLITS